MVDSLTVQLQFISLNILIFNTYIHATCDQKNYKHATFYALL